ncbi:SDR family NAD(P)-dependent oxidoreductase, partial [candidate division KSB1 bacterium]|nr:SDR family NAD(P)-dependent oxidoreductase [candidate division KSB1 bacterium]
YRNMMDINYLGVVHCLYYALPMLKVNKGMMVVISSIQGKIGVPYHTGYVASKFALQGFFQSLRMELDGSGVDILMVLPHWIRGTNLRSNAFGKDGSTLGDSRQKHTGESITVEECCRKIIKAMQKRKKELVIPPKLKLLPWLNMISPGLLEWIINKKTGEQGK